MKEIDVVLFCGGGGSSTGMKWACGKAPDVAVNHNPASIRMHAANHPETHHDLASVWEVDPVKSAEGRHVRRLWLSPDCRHFSKAKGGKPVSPKVRTLAHVGITWAKKGRPDEIYLENVQEFEDWGPLQRTWNERKGIWEWMPIPERKGEYFKKYVGQLKRLGYHVEWKLLNAMDYGAPTDRERLILIARCDGESIVWPPKTHGPGTGNAYRTTRECIEWNVPTRTIFGRKKQLAANTQRRLAEGLVRFALKPEEQQLDFLTKFYGTAGAGATLDAPCPTITATGQHIGLVQAWIAKHYTGVIGHGLDRPLGTITTTDHHSLCEAHSGAGDTERVVSWVMKYYGTSRAGVSLDAPCPTITTKHRMALAQAVVRIRDLQIVDVRMRMLTPRELARAMGFPDTFILTGTATEQVARIGNAVSPQMAKAVIAANMPRERTMAA